MNQTITNADRIYSVKELKECVSPRSVSVDETYMQEPPKLPQSPVISHSYLKYSFFDFMDNFVLITNDDADMGTKALEANEVIPHSPMRMPSGSVDRKNALLHCTLDFSESDDDDEMEERDYIQERRVRFQLTDDGEIDEELGVPSFPNYVLTPNLIKKCWYSRMERQAFKTDFPRECRALASVEYRRSAIKIAALASRSDALDLLEKDPVSQQALSVLVRPEARGFERAMMVLMMLPRKMMKAHSQNIVTLQSYQRKNGFTFNEISEALAEVASASSGSCVRMARILARGDELAKLA